MGVKKERGEGRGHSVTKNTPPCNQMGGKKVERTEYIEKRVKTKKQQPQKITKEIGFLSFSFDFNFSMRMSLTAAAAAVARHS